MTTEVKRGPCATDRCGYLLDGHDRICGEPRAAAGHTEAILLNPGEHQFYPHQHTIECSARFYREFFGCQIIDGRCRVQEAKHATGLHRTWYPEATGQAFADILGSPESDASWLAMRDIELEALKRGWEVATIATPEHGVTVIIGDDTEGYTIGDDAIWDPGRATESEPVNRPRAVALAAWGAAEAVKA